MTVLNNEETNAPASFYDLKATLISGQPFNFDQLKGKKVLLVNTASDCGYTAQYADLELLHQQYPHELAMLGFPANDFGQQEQGSNEEISNFCQVHYGVSFFMMQKSSVIKGADQNPVYAWLTDPEKNGWNDQPPVWNFCKYIVDENGKLINYFGSTVEPFSPEIINVVSK